METFSTDLDRIGFLLEGDAFATLSSQAEASPATHDGPKYTTNYIGSKQKLVDWIWRHTPQGIGSVFDAFCGSAAVAYMYKTKGMRVVANDRLHFCYHVARAIVENGKTQLPEDTVEKLLSDPKRPGSFVQDHFKGKYFRPGIHRRVDVIRTNIDELTGYQKDIALFALARTCMLATDHGHFSSITPEQGRDISPQTFDARFQNTVVKINSLVFDNGQDNKAIRGNVQDGLTNIKTDVAYFDPPYATAFSSTNYETSYHFVEGLMTYWKDLNLKGSKLKSFESNHKGVTPKTARTFFEAFLGRASHIPIWLISYRDKAYPSKKELQAMLKAMGRQTRVKSKDHKYELFNAHKTNAVHPKERLFISVRPSRQPKTKAASAEVAEPCDLKAPLPHPNHATLIAEVTLLEADGLVAVADGMSGSADPKFKCVLCRVGTNKNGDHFTRDELASHYLTAINKKVDLKHSQDFEDIVGGIVAADFVDVETEARVEITGELYTAESRHAALAYKLLRKGIVTQVSMECDYKEGECSICQKRCRAKSEYCLHLAKFKGRAFQGRPVFEILHGVTFTGLGLLDRKGADENAKITQVAASQPAPEHLEKGDIPMDETQKRTDTRAATDPAPTDPGKGGGDGGGGNGPAQIQALEARIRQLTEERDKYKNETMRLSKVVETLEAEKKAAARLTRSKDLMATQEKRGLAFTNSEAKKAELERLASLSDEAFAATQQAFSLMPVTPQPPVAGQDSEQNGTLASQSPKPLHSEAGFRPKDVDDQPPETLEQKLTQGFLAAYQERLANETGITE